MRTLRRINIATIGLTAYVAALVIYQVPYAWILALVISAAALGRKTYSLNAYGTAKWASLGQVRSVGMLDDGTGLIVGHIPGRIGRMEGLSALFNRRLGAREAVLRFVESCQGVSYKPENLVRLTNAIHSTIVAPTGVGKNVSCVTPFLLTCNDSCVVIDPKGESFNLTSATRREMGHRIVRLDPFCVCGPGGDSFNAVGSIDPESILANDECSVLAKAIVIRTGEEKDPHWQNMAEAFIGGMTSAVVAYATDNDKNLQSVRQILTNPVKMQAAIAMMCASEKWEGMLARRGNFLTNSKEKELASTLTTTNSNMSFLDTIPIANITRTSSFNPADLRSGKMTIYIILPPDHMRTQAGWLRLMISSLMLAIIRGGLQEKNRVHFVCDEAKLLGRLEQLSDMLTIGRGYGIRMQLYYQDCGQIKECWPNGADQTLLANTTQIFFGVNDQQTAEYVSSRLGEKTIVVSSWGISNGGSNSTESKSGSSTSGTNWSSNQNYNQAARKILKPEEVAALNPRTAITFTPGVPPIASWLVRYYEPSFGRGKTISMRKAIFDTSCLFLTAAFLAFLATGILIKEMR